MLSPCGNGGAKRDRTADLYNAIVRFAKLLTFSTVTPSLLVLGCSRLFTSFNSCRQWRNIPGLYRPLLPSCYPGPHGEPMTAVEKRRLTKRFIDSVKPGQEKGDHVIWDKDLKGYGLR